MIYVTEENYIEVEITDKMIALARKRAEGNYVQNSSSALNGEGNFQGKLGEIVFHTAFPKAEYVDKYTHDFIWKGKKLDIKTKTCYGKRSIVEEVSVHSYSLEKQACDGYCFVRVHNDLTIAWILGVCSKQFYRDNSIFFSKDTIDIRNKFRFYRDTNNLETNKLNTLEKYFKLDEAI